LHAIVEDDKGTRLEVEGKRCHIIKKSWKTHFGGDIVETLHCEDLEGKLHVEPETPVKIRVTPTEM